MTDSTGAAEWRLPVPRRGSGRTVWFQSVQFENVSNVVETLIE